MDIVDIIKTCKENGYTGEQALKIVRSEAKGRSMSKIFDEFYERISKMAIPIGETPALSGEELVLSPNLKKATERIKNILKHSET